MKPAARRRRKPRFNTRMPASLIAGLVLAAALLLWGLGPKPSASPVPSAPVHPEPPPASAPFQPPPAIPAAPAPESDGCPSGCEIQPPDCTIKGNLSFRTGERIYHLPGQQYYGKTVIDPAAGERWFCTEAEARANGWRKSKR